MILGKSLYDRRPPLRSFLGRLARLFWSLASRGPGGAPPGGGFLLPSLLKEGGAFLCDACGLCETVCPARCIEVLPGPGGLEDFRLDAHRCVQCRLCETVCPEGAVALSPVPHGLVSGKGALGKEGLACARPAS